MKQDFTKVENTLLFFGCSLPENGKYFAFYAPEKINIHFSFTDGSNPYIFCGSPADVLKEIKSGQKTGISAQRVTIFSRCRNLKKMLSSDD